VSGWIEYIAVAAGVAYALLAVQRIRWAWVFGGISSALLAWLAAQSALPLQSILQTVYVGMAVYGFQQWSLGETSVSPRIVRWPWQAHLVSVSSVALASLVFSPMFAAATGASWPRLDAAVTGVSLLATWMTARSVLENWLYWFAVDMASIFLYGIQGLSLVAGLYAVYFIIAIFGWRKWLAQYLRQ